MMKQLVRSAFGLLGLHVGWKRSNLDAYGVQRKVVERNDPVIFDIGAHVGSITKHYRSLFPQASISSFEPFRETFETLRNNTSGDALTNVYNLAISDEPGIVTLNSNASSATNSLLPTNSRGSSYWGAHVLDTLAPVEVEATSIDAFCREHEISHVDILKLDIQGAEYLALAGAHGLLSSASVSLVYSELILAPTYEGQRTLQDYLQLFDGYGYQLLDLYHPVKRGMRLIQADLIFLSAQKMDEFEASLR